MLKKFIVPIIILAMIFCTSYITCYNNITFTKGFPFFPKPPLSTPIEDTRTSLVVVYNINNNNNIISVKSSYNELLKERNYKTTLEKDSILAIKGNKIFFVTFNKEDNKSIIKIVRVDK